MGTRERGAEYSTEEPDETPRDDHISLMKPNLFQPYQTDYFAIGKFLTRTTSDVKEGGNTDATSTLGQGEEVKEKGIPDPEGSQERSRDTSTSTTEQRTPA